MGVNVVPNPATSAAQAAAVLDKLRFIDVGVNLTDPVFRGKYHGHQKHADDLQSMLERARKAQVKSMIITGTSLSESREAIHLAKELGLYATVGCHPTRSSEFEKFKRGPAAYLEELEKLVSANLEGPGRAVAIGECGLDYDRLHFSSAEMQKKYFRMQLGLAKKYHLPLFLHSRAAHADFIAILTEEGFGTDGGKAVGGCGGVVHSFTGTAEEVADVVRMGFHLSVNGCGMKTESNLEALKTIPPSRIMFETDAPWCSCTSTHASKSHLDSLPPELRAVFLPIAVRPERFELGKPVKGRNEPSAVGAVAWVVAKLHDVPFERVVERGWLNTVEVFGLAAELR
ncbi:Mg-dependent DNase [Auricularia subglabra TFB-10046 SS5]|nr:Mg-dependent DNase [Auricularia subglabra TFB-10046 SS5]